MRCKRRQPGFALLLTLMLVMMAAIALAAVARQSATEALSAQEKTEALQRRWAVTSCRATLLPRVDRLMDRADQGPLGSDGEPAAVDERPPPSATRWVTIELAGGRYDLVLTDEQAKYHPGRQFDDRSGVRNALSSLSGSSVGADGRRLRVAMRPMIDREADGTPIEREARSGDDDERPERIETYAGYGQLFDSPAPALLVGGPDRPGAAMRLTCWGDGRLNLKRAPSAVVERVLGPVLGAEGVDEVLDARLQAPHGEAEDWLAVVTQATAERKALASDMLSRSSYCQGLWVIARGKTRSWYAYSVLELDPPREEGGAFDEGKAGAGGDGLDAQGRVVVPAPPALHGQSNRGASRADERKGGDEEQDADPIRRYDFAW